MRTIENLNPPQKQVQKAVQLLQDIEELAKHIEDPEIMRKWVLRIAASRHSEVYNVRIARKLTLPPAPADIVKFRTAMKSWQARLAEFVGRVMKERPASTDEQLTAKFAEWERKNPLPQFLNEHENRNDDRSA